MLKKIIFALCLGLTVAIFVFQNDPIIHAMVGKEFKHLFQDAAGCQVTFKVKKINILTPSLELEDVIVVPCQDKPNSWQWQSKTMIVSISWLQLITQGVIALYLDFYNLAATTQLVQGGLGIVDQHIYPLTQSAGGQLPIYLKSIGFNKSHLAVVHASTNTTFQAQWTSQSIKDENLFKTTIALTRGALLRNARPILEQIRGAIQAQTWSDFNKFMITFNFDGAGTIYQPTGNVPCTITGSFDKDIAQFILQSSDQQFHLNPLQLMFTQDGVAVACTATLPISYLATYATANSTQSIQGSTSCTLQGQINSTDQNFVINGWATPVFCNGQWQLCQNAAYVITGTNALWTAHADITHSYAQLHAALTYASDTGKTNCTITNATPASLPQLPNWVVPEKKLHIELVQEDSIVTASYGCMAAHTRLATTNKLTANACWQDGLFTTSGSCNNTYFTLSLHTDPFSVQQILVRDGKNQPLIQASSQDAHQVETRLQFPLFKTLVKEYLSYDIQGQGHVKIVTRFDDAPIKVHIDFVDGLIRLPHTYNFINGFKADLIYDNVNKKIRMPNLVVNLYQGKVEAQQAVAQFDNDYALDYLFMPLSFQSVLLNFKKDLFARFSGELLLSKNVRAMPELKGKIILERSQLKENLFSTTFLKNLFAYTGSIFDTSSYNMACDLVIKTKHPIKVDTLLLQSQAQVNMRVFNTITNPRLAGSVELQGGALSFGYSNLDIVKGSVTFAPDQLYDPVVELLAKNNIKKHNVTLQVGGTLNNHHVLLESSPPLSEEQIIGLLLVGVPADSLQSMVPAIIVQNVKAFIFESEQSPLKLNAAFRHWLKPLKNVHLIPSFNDQTSRGGLRGAVEIDINERLSALVQKNFTLSEDTRLEVEYQLSDDVSVRGIRDERRDVGGEVEMRWKFGL